MTLVPPSPQWDAYVAERRASVRPAWDAWRSQTTSVDHPPMDVIYDVRLWTERPEQWHVCCRDGRESRSTYNPDLIYVFDDWDTLTSFDGDIDETSDQGTTMRNVSPTTVWGQGSVVVLTEQLNDVFVAPSDMDVTDIIAWLDLFRLPDNLVSRKKLANIVTSHMKVNSPTFHHSTHTHWTDVVQWERTAAHNALASSLMMMDSESRCRAGLSARATAIGHTIITEGPATLRFRFRSPSGYHTDTVAPGDTSIDLVSTTDREDHIDAQFESREPWESDPVGTVVIATSLLASSRIWYGHLPYGGVDLPLVSRPVPLDVSLPAAALPAGRRHTVTI